MSVKHQKYYAPRSSVFVLEGGFNFICDLRQRDWAVAHLYAGSTSTARLGRRLPKALMERAGSGSGGGEVMTGSREDTARFCLTRVAQ